MDRDTYSFSRGSIKVLTESSVWSKSRSRSPFMHMVRILHREHTRGHPP